MKHMVCCYNIRDNQRHKDSQDMKWEACLNPRVQTEELFYWECKLCYKTKSSFAAELCRNSLMSHSLALSTRRLEREKMSFCSGEPGGYMGWISICEEQVSSQTERKGGSRQVKISYSQRLILQRYHDTSVSVVQNSCQLMLLLHQDFFDGQQLPACCWK